VGRAQAHTAHHCYNPVNVPVIAQPTVPVFV
jgi:hypothetical protein